MLSPLQHLWGKREPNNCCNQQLTKYKNKKGQQSTQTGTGLGRVGGGRGGRVGGRAERRTTLCANEQLDFILSLGINCSFPASATGRRQRTGQVEEPDPSMGDRNGMRMEMEVGVGDGTSTMPAGCGKVCAICLSLCDSLRKWPIGVNGRRQWRRSKAKQGDEGAHLHTT